MGWRYDAITTGRPGAGLDAIVRFCRVDLPLLAFCGLQFTVFAIAVCAVAPSMRRTHDRMNAPLPGMTLEVWWLADHFWLAVACWAALMFGLCRLGRVHTPTALAVALLLHAFAIGWTIVALVLPMVSFC